MSMQPEPLTLDINGTKSKVKASLLDTLLTVLRDRFNLTAAKRGCNQGVCGACTVIVNDRPVRACLCLANNSEGARIQSLEGLNGHPTIAALQKAFAHGGAFQCGFCTPGMLVSAYALLERNQAPTDSDIRKALSGNLCRCTGYVTIIKAVQTAAADLRQEAWQS